MKSFTTYHSIGLYFMGLILLLKHVLIRLPDFYYGLGVGIGLPCLLLGIYSKKTQPGKTKTC